MPTVIPDFWGDYKTNVVIHYRSQGTCGMDLRKKKDLFGIHKGG